MDPWMRAYKGLDYERRTTPLSRLEDGKVTRYDWNEETQMLEHTPQHSADLPPPDSDPEPGIPCVQTPDPESELANWKALAKLAEGASNDAISEREAALKKADRAFATIQHLERLYAASRKNTRLMWLIGFLLGTGITASVLSFF